MAYGEASTGYSVPNTSGGKDKRHLAAKFFSMHAKKTTILNKCEDYAAWTLPGLFPRISQDDTELSQSVESLGARGVNYLSNKLVLTLFQPAQPFFRILISNDTMNALKKQAEAGDQDAKQVMNTLDETLATAEKDAMLELDYNRYRTEATIAAKLLIITGNALMYHPESSKGKVQVYSLRDYCVCRDLSGNVIEIITRDCKAFGTFTEDVQRQLSEGDSNKKYQEDTDVTIYTHVKLHEDGKYHMKQGADNVMLDSAGTWTMDQLPWIVLTWNLLRGEHYGRGLVEDYAGAFHGLHVLTSSEIDIAAACADIKWGVKPGSVVDAKTLNDSRKGSYHVMEPEDVFALQVNKVSDLQIVQTLVERLEHQISTAFLLNSSVQRDAERVTAEEIRYVAQELETAHGGIYSRFAEEWQLRTATLMLKRINLTIGKNVYPQIITGLDSLSKAGEMQNLQMLMQDLQMLKAVPDQLLAGIDPLAFVKFCAIRRGVDFTKFLKSQEQMAAEQQQAMKMQQQQANGQAAANVAQAAGESAVQG